jgi:hypothetical protein
MKIPSSFLIGAKLKPAPLRIIGKGIVGIALMTFRCPYCAAVNRAGAVFCLECGEPLDCTLPVAGSAGPAAAPSGWRGFLAGREPWVGAGIVVLLVALAVFSAWWGGRDRQWNAYRQAEIARQDHRWAAAIAGYHIAGNIADAPRRLQELTLLQTRLQADQAATVAARQAGNWWDVAVALRAMLDLDPQAVDMQQLLDARRRAGYIVYRVERGIDAGLWWVGADGLHPRQFPGGPDISLHALSPDGRWAVYTIYRFHPLPPGRHELYVLDLTTGEVHQVPIAPIADPAPNPVRFRDDGRGFWWVLGTHWSYYDLTTQQIYPIPGPVLAADPHGNGLLLTSTSLTPRSDGLATTLLLAGPTGAQPRILQTEVGSIRSARFSPDGQFLTYQVRTLQDQRLVDRLVVYSLTGADGSLASSPNPVRRYLIAGTYAVDPQEAGSAPFSFQEAFLPPAANGALPYIAQAPGQPVVRVSDLRSLNRPPAGRDGTAAPPQRPGSLVASWQTAGPDLGLGPGLRVDSLLIGDSGQFAGVRLSTASGLAADWLGFAAKGRYSLYLAPDGHGDLGLYSVPVGGAQAGAGGLPAGALHLLSRAADPYAWIRNTALSHDGSRILAIRGPSEVGGPPVTAPSAAGLWAFRPDGTDPTLLVPDVVEFWTVDGWLAAP